MNRKRHNSPWIWIPALFATEAIASAMVTYVALLMFVQLGASFAKAALMAALLMLPSVLKLFLGWKQKYNPYLKSMLILQHFCRFLCHFPSGAYQCGQ